MFKRRHPLLFSFLVLAGIFMSGMVALSLITVLASGGRIRTGLSNKVGVVELDGTITDSRIIVESLADFRKNDKIKAIVLRVDSPGGSLGPSQEIYAEVKKTVAEKKVIVSMGSVAASGGYYVSSCASGIMANPGTVTGSIGVIMAYTNAKGLMDKVGLSPVVIKSGKFKDTGSPFRDMTAEERALLNETIQAMYMQFVDDIVKGRKMKKEKILEIADGRIFTGIKAKELGLVDRLGNMEDAITWAGELGGLGEDPAVIYANRSRFAGLEKMMESASKVMESAASAVPVLACLWMPPA